MAIGIAILVWIFFQPKHYQEICSNPLLFDEAIIKLFVRIAAGTGKDMQA